MTSEYNLVCRLFRFVPEAPKPRPALRSADGMVPARGFQYCEALRMASGFGWYLFPPINFALMFTGVDIVWTYEGAPGWFPLDAAKFPGFGPEFRKVAPEEAAPFLPSFLAASREPGLVQIWSGYFARTVPGWALQSRAPVNVPRTRHFEQFEGIIEPDGAWFGPLFTNVRLTRPNLPVEFHKRYPLLQVQPLPRRAYREASFEMRELADLETSDWQRYTNTMRRNADPMRPLGQYAAETRKRMRALESSGCPYHAAAD